MAQPGRLRRPGRGLKTEEKSANSQFTQPPHTQKFGHPPGLRNVCGASDPGTKNSGQPRPPPTFIRPIRTPADSLELPPGPTDPRAVHGRRASGRQVTVNGDTRCNADRRHDCAGHRATSLRRSHHHRRTRVHQPGCSVHAHQRSAEARLPHRSCAPKEARPWIGVALIRPWLHLSALPWSTKADRRCWAVA